MSNAIIKPALNNLSDIKTVFFNYAEKGKASETANPYWSLYQGEDTKAPRIAYNWHLSDVNKSWSLLEENLTPYVNSGGTFFLTMSDKPRDNAPSVLRLIDFNPFRNMSQNGASINGFNGGVYGGDMQKAIDTHVELAMLRKEVSELRNGGNKGINAILTPIVQHPNFNPDNVVNGFFMLFNKILTPAAAATNGTPQTVTTNTQPVEQAQTNSEIYEYNTNELLQGLEKVRAKLKGVRPEILVIKIGDFIESSDPIVLNTVLGFLGFNYDANTGICTPKS